MKKTMTWIVLGLLITGLLSACQSLQDTGATVAQRLIEVTLMLDWVPNTNHTGIFVAQDQGYFNDAGLELTIIEPGEVYAEQAVSAGAADFGVSFQEQVTLARSASVPLVSIAAIIQHNTSAFAGRGALQISSPADWEGLRYGAFGSPFEEPTLRVLMSCAGSDFDTLEIVDTGFADPLALLSEARTDLAWIFYAWQGLQAEQKGLDLDLVMMADWLDCIPDYYTPVLITSEATIMDRPEVVRAFLKAVTRGYQFAIEDPDAAAQILLQAVPELDADLVLASQAWISPRYQADAARWGEQQVGVWEAYSQWMAANGIVGQAIDADAAMTNRYLP
ncbi:MAG: ABC transporter substrate-binding protein [Anaerolineales bacterium]|nr:MAG: ABC transporter substrate-binding protein [Anaerolineales bacterium]